MTRINSDQNAQIHAHDDERDTLISQKTVSLNDKHRKEVSIEDDIVPVESMGEHRHVFHETTQGAEAVEKVGINWDDLQKSTQAVNIMYST